MTPPAARPRLELRVSVTERCPMRCLYCSPTPGEPPPGAAEPLSFGEIARFVRVLSDAFEIAKIHLTGGEPLVRRGLADLVSALASCSTAELALTTNGQLLEGAAAGLRRAGLRRVNVSLDSLDPATFESLGGGRLERTLRGIDEAIRCGLAPVKINTVVLRGLNDHEAADLARFAIERGAILRFLELMPIGCAGRFFRERFVPAWEVRERLARTLDLTPLRPVPGRTSREYLAVDRSGRRGILGFVAPESERFCDGCARIRLTSSGRLLRCLARNDGPSVAPLLRSDDPGEDGALVELVAGELGRKTARVTFELASPMSSVGG